MISNFLFIILNISILSYSFRSFVRGKYVIINFKSLFTLGFIYYLVLPYYFLVFTKDNSVRAMFSGVYFYVKNISEKNLCMYLISIFILYFSIMFFSKFHIVYMAHKDKKSKYSTIYKMIYFLLVILCLSFIYKFRGALGKGYTESDNMTGGKGSFISSSLLLFITSFFIVHPQRKSFSIYTFIYFIFALLIMTMGGRIYFLTSMICIFVFISHYKHPVRIRNLIFIVLVSAVLFSTIGVIRQGNKTSGKLILFVFLGEPILTSYSLFSCLDMNSLPILKFPLEFISGIINLIPSFILPNKLQLVNKASEFSNVLFVTPVGAENIFTSLMVNFGILGIPFFSCMISLLLRFIRNLNQNLYLFATSWFVFTFFRDPLYVSCWKLLFEFCFLFPIILFCFNNFVSLAIGRRKIECNEQ